MVVRLRANYEFGKQTKFLSRGHIVGIHAKRGNLDKLRLIIAPGSHGQNASMVISDNTDGSEITTNICILEPGEKKTSNQIIRPFWSVYVLLKICSAELSQMTVNKYSRLHCHCQMLVIFTL